MIHSIIANVNIGDRPLPYTSITLIQAFNEHHEFTIKVDHDVLETQGTLSLENSKALVGEYVVISLFSIVDNTVLTRKWDFKGIICSISVIAGSGSNSEIVLKGYSPTILMEDGPGYASYNEKTLAAIVDDATANFAQSSCTKNINPSLTSPIKYVTRYNESNFHFINRLSNDYGELFYYDGMALQFGSPSIIDIIEVVSGVDMSNMQLNMKVSPIEAWGYAYASKTNEQITTRGNDIEGLDPYPGHMVQVAKNLYSNLDDVPVYQPIETTNQAEYFVQKAKEAIAADLVEISGTTTNPDLFLARVADIKISRTEGTSLIREDYGAYLVTAITHHITQTGSYYNTFTGLSAWVRGIPVKRMLNPMAEPQFGWIHSNKDPQKLGRVQVQMQWQKEGEHTDWIWVMTPDAGSGKDGAKGGGFVVMPENGDRVLIGFVHNNPDRPFVMGSLFHGKSAPDGGLRCLTARRSSAKVCIDDGAGSITIEDGGQHKIVLDGAGNINVSCSTKISLKVGSSEITIEPSKITIKSTTVKVDSSTADIQGSTKAVIKQDDGTCFKAEGGEVTMKAVTANVKGTAKVSVSGTQVEINGTAKTDVKGGLVNINA